MSESNALVLGSSGVNVGIGTSSPAALLDVEGGTAANYGQNGAGLQLIAQPGAYSNPAAPGGAGGAINISGGNGGSSPSAGGDRETQVRGRGAAEKD
ncbi:MAG: hypothetical protein ACLQOO_07570 [Terriglobia bacterium]